MANDPPASNRFKPAMPHIPGVTDGASPPRKFSLRLVAPLGAAIVAGTLLGWWMLRSTPRKPLRDQSSAPAAAAEPVQTNSPAVAPVAAASAHSPAAISNPDEIATLEELARPWSSKRFIFRKGLSGAAASAIVVRLPGGPANRSGSYWAFSLQAPFGQCELVYLTDVGQLARQYGYRAAHAMVGDPCNGTVYDPLRMGTLPGGAWARGEVVQGPGIRPPIGIEVRLEGHRLVATRSE